MAQSDIKMKRYGVLAGIALLVLVCLLFGGAVGLALLLLGLVGMGYLIFASRRALPMPARVVLRSVSLSRARSLNEPLAIGDSVMHDDVEYTVEGIETSLADGQTWRLVHLLSSGGGAHEHWLSVWPGRVEVAWLSAVEVEGTPGAPHFRFRGASLPLVDAASAILKVQQRSGVAPALFARVWRYRAGSLVAEVEEWSDGTQRAFAGSILERESQVATALNDRKAA